MALQFSIEVDDKGTPKVKNFKGEIKKTGKASEVASKALMGTTKAMAAIGAAGAAAGVAMFSLTAEIADQRDRITKLGRQYGVTTEFLSSMGHSARLGGADLKTVETGLAKLSRTANDANSGLATAKKAFDDIGVSVKDANGDLKSNEVLVMEISDAFKDLPDGPLKAAKAQEIFGRSGKELINTLNGGSEALKAQAEEAKALGLVFDQEAGEKAELFNDTLLRLQSSAEGVFTQIGAELMPLVTESMDEIIDVIELGGPAIIQVFQSMIPAITSVAGLLTDTALGWAQITKDLGEALDMTSQFEDLEDPEVLEQLKKMTEGDKKRAAEKEALLAKEVQAEKSAQASILRERQARQKTQSSDSKKAADEAIEQNRIKVEAMLDEEQKYFDYLDEAEKELDQGVQELTAQQIEAEKSITMALMTESDRRRFIIEEEHNNRIRLIGESAEAETLKARQLQELDREIAEERKQNFVNQMDNIGNITGNISQALANITQAEQNKINENFDKRKVQVEKEYEQRLKAAEGDAEATEKLQVQKNAKLQRLDEKREQQLQRAAKRTAEARKRAAQLEAIVNTAAAVTKALPNFFLAGAVGLVGAAEVAAIETAQFFKGGDTGSTQGLISVGENGREFVVSGSGTRAADSEALNDLNNGRIEDAANRLSAQVGGVRGATFNFNGGIIDENFMNNTLIPKLQEWERLQ